VPSGALVRVVAGADPGGEALDGRLGRPVQPAAEADPGDAQLAELYR
jgi:hypothetical protein